MRFSWDYIAPHPEGLVRPVKVDPLGVIGPTRGRARGPSWRQTSPGWFVPAEVSDDVVEQRIVEVSVRGGQRSVVTGWASLRLHGAGSFDGLAPDGLARLPVPVAANGSRLDDIAGVAVSRFVVPPDEQVIVHGVRCASIERSLFDEMRRVRSIRRMVVVGDMTFAAGRTSIRRMRRYTYDRRWYRDRRRIEDALELCDEHAKSGPEVSFRLVWDQDAGWGHPLCNRPVLDETGRVVAVPDLLCPRRGVAGEYAGSYHRDIDQHARDIRREAAMRDVGLEYVEIVGRDLQSPAMIVRRMEEAARRARASSLPRRWTTGPPLSPTLDEYLDGLAVE